jgi:serum/glucocorticoid-regulated kinase 2
VSPPPAPAKPGILIVTLHEGKGFSLPAQYQQAFSNQVQGSMAGSIGAGSFRPGTASARGPSQMAGSMARPQSTGGGINAAPTNHGRYASRYLPYVLLDFDKVQVFVDAVSGTPENPYWAGDNTQYKFDVSRTTDLSAQVYLRNPAARPGVGRNDDIFLGATKIKPRFEEVRQFASDPKSSKKEKTKEAEAFADREKSLGQAGAEWSSLTFGTGSIRIGVNFVENREQALKMEDFELLKVVGKGSFGKVMQVM